MTDRHRHALVTGASSGIGRATVLRLAAAGYHVYGTVRRAADAKALEAAGAGRVDAPLLDVTDEESIARVVATVAAHVGDRGLDLLVNNAGVGLFRPLECAAGDGVRTTFATNVDGVLAVTRHALPLLRVGQGRIVMIGSVVGRITVPFAGVTVATKRAVQALAEALRLELAGWNIRVILLEPASIRTEAVDKVDRETADVEAALGVDGARLYGGTFRRMRANLLRMERGGSDPSVVGDAVVRAATARRPRPRYLVGKDSRRLAVLATLPPWLLDPLRRRMFGLPRPGSLVSTRTDVADRR